MEQVRIVTIVAIIMSLYGCANPNNSNPNIDSVAIDQSEVTGYAIGDQFTATASSSVTWSSSDTSVADSTGLVVGYGSTSLTATCGVASDQLDLTANGLTGTTWEYDGGPFISTMYFSDTTVLYEDVLVDSETVFLTDTTTYSVSGLDLDFTFTGNASGVTLQETDISDDQFTANNIYSRQ